MIKSMAQALPAVKTFLEEGNFDCLWLVGDHQLIPQVPTGCIFPAVTAREIVGAPRRVQAVLTLYILVYHGEVSASIEDNESAQTLFVDSIVSHLEQDASFADQLVINTFVPRIDYGETQRGRNKYHTSRLSLQLTTRYNIGV